MLLFIYCCARWSCCQLSGLLADFCSPVFLLNMIVVCTRVCGEGNSIHVVSWVELPAVLWVQGRSSVGNALMHEGFSWEDGERVLPYWKMRSNTFSLGFNSVVKFRSREVMPLQISHEEGIWSGECFLSGGMRARLGRRRCSHLESRPEASSSF